MNYSKKLDPELKYFDFCIPYNRFMIKLTNLILSFTTRLTRIPKGLQSRYEVISGYQGMKVRLQIIEPRAIKEVLPCLVDIHGGGFSYKASGSHIKIACEYAKRAKCRVILPDYHLSPKYPFPAGFRDVLASYRWIIDNAVRLDIDTKRIGVVGDSAGGALTALLCNAYERENLVKPCAQLMIYPVTDIEMKTQSMKEFADTPVWNSRYDNLMWQLYLGKSYEANLEDVRMLASPMQNDLPTSIPNTFIETTEYDCLRDEGKLYAEKLVEAGASVVLNETLGTFHAYDSAMFTDIAKENITKRIQFMNQCFYKE